MVQGRIARTLAVLTAASVAAVVHAQVGSLPDRPSPASYIAEGQRHLDAREDALAADAYAHAIELDANQPAAYAGLGAAYYRMGRIPDSVTAFDEALRLDPARPTVRLNRAISLRALNRADEALVDLSEAERLAAGNAPLLNQVAITLTNEFRRPEAAITVYREAIAADPNAAAVHHNLGLLFVRLGRYGEAVEPFAAALRIDPAFRNARFFLAESYSRLQQYEASVDSWSKFLGLVPDGPDATENRAWDYLCWGGHGQPAGADARRWLEIAGWNETSSPYMVLVAHFGSLEAGKPDEARLVLDEAAVKLVSRAWPYPIVRYLRGEMDEDALLRVTTTNDHLTEMHAYVGMELLQRGHADAARTHLQWVIDHGNRGFREYPLAARAVANNPFPLVIPDR